MTGVLLLIAVPVEAYHRGPCGCGSDGCWVLVADGDDGPLLPEIHLPERAA